jgi:hypothetical protein
MVFKRGIICILGLFIIIISGCSASFKEESKDAKEVMLTTLNNPQRDVNTESEGLAMYLPFGFHIKNEEDHNIIIEKNNKSYILFHNPNEDELSEVVYEVTTSLKDDYDVKETFKDDEKFGYLLIANKQQDNELVVGIGGTKISTETKNSTLAKDTEYMVEIIQSVHEKDK